MTTATRDVKRSSNELCFINLASNSVFRYSLLNLYPTSPVAMKSAEGGEQKCGYVFMTINRLSDNTDQHCYRPE